MSRNSSRKEDSLPPSLGRELTIKSEHLGAQMRIGDRIVRLESCSSTNDVAKDLASQGEPEGTVVIAEEQTKGRGRLDHRWFSSRKMGLYASLLLRPRQSDVSLLTLMGGVALCEAVRASWGIHVCLKWPNDLLWKGKKLGGILCEGSMVGNCLEYVILGFGLNVRFERDDFPEGIQTSATSVKQIIGEDPDPDILLSQLLRQLDNWYGCFLSRDSREITSAFMERSCFPLGGELEIETAAGTVSGVFRGLGSQGELILESAEGRKAYFEAEIRSLLAP
jgi:BirA family biotin operon repressor/biotin-[acetyl-CoA-carboxylase] ligase